MRAEPARPAGLAALLSLELGRGQALGRTELTNVTRELSIMLGAGQDIDRALRFLVDTDAQPPASPPSWNACATPSATASRWPRHSASNPAPSPASTSA